MWYDQTTGNPIAFYHSSTYRAVTAVLDFFKDVYIVRDRRSGSPEGHRVPIRFEGKDVYAQYQNTPEKKRERDINEVLPSMSLGMPFPPQPFKDAGMTGDPKLVECVQTCPRTTLQQYAGRPFQLNFELTLRANKLHELFNMYEVIMSRIWRGPVVIPILETDLEIKRDLYLGNIDAKWGEWNPVFLKGSNSRPSEIIIGFTIAPIFLYPPITDAQGIIKHIEIDYKNLCDTENPLDPVSFVVNNWDVEPENAEVEDPHQEVLTQTLLGETHEIIRDDVNQ